MLHRMFLEAATAAVEGGLHRQNEAGGDAWFVGDLLRHYPEWSACKEPGLLGKQKNLLMMALLADLQCLLSATMALL